MATTASQNVSDYLSKKQVDAPKDIAGDWAQLEELHNKK